MTGGTDLVELLAAATIHSPPPSAAALRRRARQARRRRLGACVAAGVVVLAVGVAAAVTRRPPSYDVATINSTTVAPSTAAPPTTEPPPAVAAGEQSGPAVLMPPDGWQLAALNGRGYTAPDATVLAVTGPAGPAGPMAWIRFNAGVGTLDYPDGPITHHDTTSPAGHTVRVGWSTAREDLAAIRVVEGGSVAIGSSDIGEDELLALIDAVTVAEGRVLLDAAALPTGFSAGPATPDRPYLTTSYLLQGASGTVNVLVTRWAGAGSDASASIRLQPTIVETTVNGHKALIAPADPATDSGASALLIDRGSWDEPGWAYSFSIPPATDTGPDPTVAEIEALLTSLQPVEPDELVAEVPWLEDRAALIDRWSADVPVPASADLSVLREGPPISRGEAEWVYRVLACAVTLDWAATGNNERLDQLASSVGWTVGTDLNRYWENIVGSRAIQVEVPLTVDRLVPGPEVLAQAREATTADERWATTLVDDCQWAVSLTGQGRS